jgi:uncharacterized protein (DUF885 family)
LVQLVGRGSRSWDFFHAHSAVGEVDRQREADRDILWPGQAVGYKVGQLKVLEFRDGAKHQLGASIRHPRIQ